MDNELARKNLYDLIWSQPMKTVAARIGISDAARHQRADADSFTSRHATRERNDLSRNRLGGLLDHVLRSRIKLGE